MTDDADRELSPNEAQAIQDQQSSLAWFLTACDPRHPGKHVARPHTSARDGGRFLSTVLLSDTLENLRARLPAGVSRRYELSRFVPPDAIELWD